MSFLFIFLVTILMPTYLAFRTAGPIDGKKVASITAIFSCFLLGLIAIINMRLPFAGGGDDTGYYFNSVIAFQSLDSLMSIIRSSYEQPGYPLLLTLVNAVAGDSLFARKAVNLSLFMLTALCWYQIGLLLGGRKTAYICFFGVLLATPIWYYFLFLLKDIPITLLFSLFILGAFRFFLGKKGIMLMLISSLGLLLFRMPLAVANIAILVVFSLVLGRAKRPMHYFISAAIILLILWLGLNADLLGDLGIARTRALTAESIRSQMEFYSSMREGMSIPRNLLLYLVVETSGFRALNSWDSGSIRGLSAIPWIFLGLPFFCVGVRYILRNWRRAAVGENRGLLCLLAIIVMYLLISLVVNDTTRWRIPGFPAMVAVAGIGWQQSGKRRLPFVVLAMAIGCLAFSTYYFLKGM